MAGVSDIYLKALGGKRTGIKPVEFPNLLNQKYYYPLRATCHELDTFRNSWSIDSKLFFMDETSSFDLIEYWNLRALGWHIEPLPASLAPYLIDYCNEFIKSVYRPFPPPSNAYHHASMLCAKSQSVEKLQEFMSKLTGFREHMQSSTIACRAFGRSGAGVRTMLSRRQLNTRKKPSRLMLLERGSI